MPERFSNGKSQRTTKPSNWWYLVPILAGFVGGLIGWLVLKDKYGKFAKRLLIIGIVITVVIIILNVASNLLLQYHLSNWYIIH